jgi:hypothetical protein
LISAPDSRSKVDAFLVTLVRHEHDVPIVGHEQVSAERQGFSKPPLVRFLECPKDDFIPVLTEYVNRRPETPVSQAIFIRTVSL